MKKKRETSLSNSFPFFFCRRRVQFLCRKGAYLRPRVSMFLFFPVPYLLSSWILSNGFRISTHLLLFLIYRYFWKINKLSKFWRICPKLLDSKCFFLPKNRWKQLDHCFSELFVHWVDQFQRQKPLKDFPGPLDLFYSTTVALGCNC